MRPTPLSPTARIIRRLLLAVFLVPVAFASACGGGAGGPAAGQGLALLSFAQASVDNVTLNQTLVLDFSATVDPASITAASVQLREGPAFGSTVRGKFVVSGARVSFEPNLPTLCDLSDAGLKLGTQYRLLVVGGDEEFSVRNMAGQSIQGTRTFEFRTVSDDDPTRFHDQVPGVGPSILNITPGNGSQAVAVAPGNKVEILLSENLDPCTVTADTVRFFMHETGDPLLANNVTAPNGNGSGFYAAGDTSDQVPADPTTWGADVSSMVSPAQRVLANIELVQSLAETKIVITPLAGYSPDPRVSAPVFPENSLLVVDLTFGITDFGGLPLVPATVSFTTENLPVQNGQYNMLVEGETPFQEEGTSADVDTERSPSRIQGYLVFAGEGDNGANLFANSGPDTPASGCTQPYQAKDGVQDDFDATADAILDTGAAINTCPNETDGSTAVTFEFRTFRIRSGATVRIVGVNPAIIKVAGDVYIDAGGTLLALGDGQGGAPDGDGTSGQSINGVPLGRRGGRGVAGGGDGGDSQDADNTKLFGEDGTDGYGSDDYGMQGGAGSGKGNVNAELITHNQGPTLNAASGGGGGNAAAGEDGEANGTSTVTKWSATPEGQGGDAYGDGEAADRLLLPFAGSGGGASGAAYSNYTDERASGGSGGAGGGFVDFTASGNIYISGTINASGGRGGAGVNSPWGQENQSSGGGGGAGGGIRLLTPRDINLSGGTVTAAGGPGGVGAVGTTYPGPRNNGGDGAPGRIVMEDSDSIIAGLGTATVSPGEGDDGFFRGIFDGGRFKGGGTQPGAVTEVFAVGPLNPVFLVPIAGDFDVGIPTVASRGVGATSILIEAQGFQILPDGVADMSSGTGWKTVGFFRDSSVESAPTWVPSANPVDVPLPPDNSVGSMLDLNTYEFVQFRVTMYLPTGVGPDDAGPFLDTWRVQFTSDQ